MPDGIAHVLRTFTFGAKPKVTGVVVDEFGDPLPGANITVVGNQNLATATNMEGQFTLNNVPKDAILNVRFIGYAVKTIRLATLKNNDLLRIVLSEDVKELNDVVVTALGISRESKSLGYARQSIDTESLLDTRDPNLLNSLSGKVSALILFRMAVRCLLPVWRFVVTTP